MSSGYIRFLPAIYATRAGTETNFVERYLWIFEAILGAKDADAENIQQGLAPLLDILPSLLYPRFSFLFPDNDAPMPPIEATGRGGVPDEATTKKNLQRLNSFLGVVPIEVTKGQNNAWQATVLEFASELVAWLSGWIAFAPDPRWGVDVRRNHLAALMPIYRLRGTPAGMEKLLSWFFPAELRVIDLVDAQPLLLGDNTVLEDSYTPGEGVLDGIRPFSFAVELALPTYDFESAEVIALRQQITRMVDAEKPMHTRWIFQFRTTTFTIGKYSTVGVNTLIPKSGAQT